MWLGQRHGAEEAAFDHWLQVALFLFLGAEALDQVGRAHGQHRVGRGPCVGRLEMGKAGLRQQVRHLHAALFKGAGGVQKARLEEGVDRRFDFRDQLGRTVDVLGLVLVALAVVWCEQLFRDGAGSTDGRVEGLAVVIGKARALGQRFGVQHFIEFKRQVALVNQQFGHGSHLYRNRGAVY